MKVTSPIAFVRKALLGKLKSSRARFLVAFCIGFLFIYEIIPSLLFKTSWKHIGWRDPNYKLSVLSQKYIQKNEIIVLRWTSQWGAYEKPEILTSDKCPYLNISGTSPSTNASRIFDLPCRITFDRRYLKRSDALVFHSFDLLRQEVPKIRSSDQPWVYVQQECPIYTKLNLQAYHNVFNWTMTYRRDSDVYHPYGHIVPHSNEEPQLENLKSIRSQLPNRTNLVAWIVSSCDSYSKREYLVKQLQHYINVDVYGWCGEDCPKGNCYDHVSTTHKFYLSFENSLCTDYITEKFFNALRANIVPVVYGGARASDYSTIAPEGSYIDARNFKSTKELAEYLLYLDKNDDEYLKYFEWKKRFKVVSGQGWCNLCQRAYEHFTLISYAKSGKSDRKSKANKWYKDLWKWWNYMSYDTEVEVNDQSNLHIVGSSYYFKMGESACLPAMRNLTRSRVNGKRVKLDFEPGIWDGRIFGKVVGWIKETVF